MQVDNGALRDFLIDSGLMTRGQLESVLAATPATSLYDTLVARSMLAEDELRRAAAHVAGVPFVLLTREDFSPEALMLVPEPLARAHNIVAFKREGNTVEVALLDLDDIAHLEFLQKELRVLPRLTSAESVKHGLLHYQKLLKEKFAALAHSSINAVDALLSHALLSNASGVHLDLSTAGMLVRYRIGSALHAAMTLPKEAAHIIGRFKELAKLSFTLNVPQEGHFKVELEGGGHVGVRVATTPLASGERMTLHLTRHGSGRTGFSLRSLGLHGRALEDVHTLLRYRSGLIVVSGKKGSGKSATLYTLLDMLAHLEVSVVTVEEEIEHRLQHVAQIQVRKEAGLTLAGTLRAALKQDPDIVMVGKLEGSEAAALAASAVTRGILVLAGVEAASPKEVEEKFGALGISQEKLGFLLRGIVGVALVRRVCPHCKEDFRLSRAEGAPLEDQANFGRVLAALKEEGIVSQDAQWKDLTFARAGAGCKECLPRAESGGEGGPNALVRAGYKGFVGLQEGRLAGEEGLNIIEDGLFKAAQGITSVEEVVRAAQEG